MLCATAVSITLLGCSPNRGPGGGDARLSHPLLMANGGGEYVYLVETGENGVTFRKVPLGGHGYCATLAELNGEVYTLLSEGLDENKDGLYRVDAWNGGIELVLPRAILGKGGELASVGNSLYMLRRDGGVVRIDPHGKTADVVAQTVADKEFHGGFAAVGDELAFVPRDGVVVLLNTSTGTVEEIEVADAWGIAGAAAGCVVVACPNVHHVLPRHGGSVDPALRAFVRPGRSVRVIDGTLWGVHSGGDFTPDRLVNLQSGEVIKLPSSSKCFDLVMLKDTTP